MNKKEMMLKQIDSTLKQEEMYLKEFDKQLQESSLTYAARERISLFKEASLAAIDRCKKARLQYV